jgi:hypothetical protein
MEATLPPSLPSGDTGTNIISHDALFEVIPDNILAFRTITTLLEGIRQQPFNFSDNGRTCPSDSEQEELRVSTAFSRVAVPNHDDVAVVVKRTIEELEVVVCTSIPSDELNQQVGKVPIIINTEMPPGLEAGYKALSQYLKERW